jgi:hypothetical protein
VIIHPQAPVDVTAREPTAADLTCVGQVFVDPDDRERYLIMSVQHDYGFGTVVVLYRRLRPLGDTDTDAFTLTGVEHVSTVGEVVAWLEATPARVRYKTEVGGLPTAATRAPSRTNTGTIATAPRPAKRARREQVRGRGYVNASITTFAHASLAGLVRPVAVGGAGGKRVESWQRVCSTGRCQRSKSLGGLVAWRKGCLMTPGFFRLGSSAVVGGDSRDLGSDACSPGPEEDIGDLDWLDPFIDQAKAVSPLSPLFK